MNEEQWQAILRQWEGDDAEEAADDLESGKDAMDLAAPATWAEQDAPVAAASKIAAEGAQSMPEVSSFRPSTSGGRSAAPSLGQTASASRDAARSSTPSGDASLSDPPKMDWKQLKTALTNADLRAMQTRAGESMRANIVQGYKPDLEGSQQQRATARIPLEVANAQQNFEAKESATGVKKAMDDPNSLQSQKAREAWRAFGLKTPPGFDNWSAADIQRNVGPAQNAAQREGHATETAAKAKSAAERKAFEDTRHETERAQDLEHRKLSHEDSMANAAATRALAANAQSKLPAGEAATLGGSDAALKAIEDLSSEWESKASATGSGLTQYVPGSDANTYLPSLRSTMQVVGTFLEGGKLTDADVPKYAAMMPQPQDTKAQKDAKIAALQRLISTTRDERSKGLRGAGYRTPDPDVTPEIPAIAPKRPPDVPSTAKRIGNTWQWRAGNGKILVVEDEAP